MINCGKKFRGRFHVVIGSQENTGEVSFKTITQESYIMNDDQIDKIFAGDVDDLPALSTKLVRIFTSSTFTDMLMERNVLMQFVYPKLKSYCRERHGIEFRVR